MKIDYAIDPFPKGDDLDALWRRAWGKAPLHDMNAVLSRSLGHVGADTEDRIVGFVNVAWDGGIHAFILDTCVDPDYRRRGIATALVRHAVDLASARGAQWLHVDFEERLEAFYKACGFGPTRAGLIDLKLGR